VSQVISEYSSDNRKTDEEIDLKKLWAVITRNKWKIIWLTITLTLMSVLVLFFVTPIYKAQTFIMLETQQANVVSIEAIYGLNSGNSEYYNSQIEVIKSRKIIAKVVEKLDLTQHVEFDPRQQKRLYDYDEELERILPENWSFIISNFISNVFLIFEKEEKKLSDTALLELIIDKILSKLTVTAHKKSLIVRIAFESPSPELAAKITDEIAKGYIENGFESRLQMTQNAVSWLTVRLGKIRKDLSAAEKNLIAYRSKENLLDVKGVQTIAADELKDISAKLSNARLERAKMESIYQQVKSITQDKFEYYELIPGMFEYTVVQQAKSEISKASQMVVKYSKRYGKKNPKMISVKGDLDKAKANYLVLLKNIAKGIEKKYWLAKTNEETLLFDLKSSKSKIRNINNKKYQLKVLEREVETSRQLYETFFTRFKETNETSGLQSANSSVVDYAVIPKSPIKPKKKLVVFIVFLLSLGLGVVLSFVNEGLNTTLISPEDVQLRLSKPLLGALPLLKLKKRDLDIPLLGFINDNKSPFSEAIRTIRTGVVLSGLDCKLKVAVVTSSIPNEGKTTVSINLAMSLGAMEKVLLIDGDLRRPSIAKACYLEGENGLSSLVAGTADFSECIHSMHEWGIDILPAGVIPPNPQELLGSKRFTTVLEELGKKYERIIIDTAPTQAVSDALLLAKHANEVIYVVKANSTSYTLVNAGVDSLDQINANVSGIILNYVDFKKAQKYSDDYYNGYYSNYGYS